MGSQYENNIVKTASLYKTSLVGSCSLLKGISAMNGGKYIDEYR